MDAIITALIQGLQAKGFPVRRAKPWVRSPRVTACCGVVGIQKLTVRPGGRGEAVLYLQVYGPGKSGAQACEAAAEAMASALAAGLGEAVPPLTSVAGECGYDGAGDFFSKRLTVTMAVDLGSQGAALRSPAVLKTGEVTAALVTEWTAEARQTAEPLYGFGDGQAVGTVTGRRSYVLELKGILPQNGQDPESLAEFTLEIPGEVQYTGCTWQRFTRAETAEGVSRSGDVLARARQEV